MRYCTGRAGYNLLIFFYFRLTVRTDFSCIVSRIFHNFTPPFFYFAAEQSFSAINTLFKASTNKFKKHSTNNYTKNVIFCQQILYQFPYFIKSFFSNKKNPPSANCRKWEKKSLSVFLYPYQTDINAERNLKITLTEAKLYIFFTFTVIVAASA